MEPDGVVFYSINKNSIIIAGSSRKYLFLYSRGFVYKIRYLNKRIHVHLDRQGFDWTKKARLKTTPFGR